MSELARAETLSKAAPKPAPRQQSEIGRAMRLFLRFTAGQRGNFLLAALMLILEALSAVAIPLVIAYLIDGYLTPRLEQIKGVSTLTPLSPLQQLGLPTLTNADTDTVLVVTVAIVLLTIVNSATDSLAEIFLAKGGRMLGLNLRVALYAHLQRLSLAFYGKQRTGDLLTRVTGDVTALEDFVTASLSDIIGSILLIGFTLAAIVFKAWQIAVIAVVVIPIMALVSNYFSQRIKSASKKQRAREGDLAASAQEMLTSIRVIQTYGRTGNQEQRFAAQSRKTMESALEAAGLQARFSGTVSVLESIAVAVVIWLGVVLLFQAPLVLGVGLLTAFIKYIQDMFKPTKKIIKEWNTFGKIYASVERIGEIFDRQPAVQDAPGAVEAPKLQGQIEYQHVSFAYQLEGEQQDEANLRLALRDLNFSVTPGQVVALVGASGAGKSTIVQLLPRLYDPHAGRITIDGHDLREFTLDSLRARMSMVLQEAILFTGSVAENIAYGVENATHDQIVAAAMKANAHEFIEKLPDGYDTELSERASNLSGGQRQRIAIARAFIRDTPILILDEPTTGLDAESTELVLLALRSLMKDRSTVIISHDLNLIRNADKIVVIEQGTAIQQGTHRELLKSGGLYAALYHKQFGVAIGEGQAHDEPAPAAPAEPEDEDELDREAAKKFRTLIDQVLPQPARANTGDTMLIRVVPDERPAAEQAAPPQTPAPHVAPATVMLRLNGDDGAAAGDRQPAALQLDPLQNPGLAEALPGLATALDGAAMREYLQIALFGRSRANYQIERCEPGKAIFAGGMCTLRYQLQVADTANGHSFEALASGRVFGDQWTCATYMRDKLAPLATLMHGRPEIRPFAAPVAMIEPLNMVVHAYPIDGELPTLVGATDLARMRDVFAETLSRATNSEIAVEGVRVVPVNYARRYRCVMRYEIEAYDGDESLPPIEVYGKISTDNQGAAIDRVVGALRDHVLADRRAYQFAIPRSLGFRPDLQLSLMEAIPGQPRISQLLKERLSGRAGADGELTLEQALEACARIARRLHESNILLGRRRTLDDELAALQRDIQAMQQVAPELGAQFQEWLERIGSYAEASDPLPLCFSHGDYTYSQLIFDGSRSGLVDFDTVCQAEPALDLGQFLAYLRVAAHKARRNTAPGATPIGEQLGEQFLRAYMAGSGEQLEDAERMRIRTSVYEVVSLLRMALHSWQQLKGSRLENAIAVFEEAIARLPQLDY
jgi:ABC-type multidrug transport system fused ATPase/permease subunit/thiamine kinase-like enzyme